MAIEPQEERRNHTGVSWQNLQLLEPKSELTLPEPKLGLKASVDLGLDSKYIHPNIALALQDILQPIAQKHDCDILLKGGLAVAILLGEQARKTSPDIDFTVQSGREGARKILEIGLDLVAQNGYHFGQEVLQGDELQERWKTGMYHIVCRKGKMTTLQPEVEYDAIAETRVQPGNKGFCYQFPVSAADVAASIDINLPNASTSKSLPIDHLIVEKLLAGRGADKHKFDLYDAAGLLANFPDGLNPRLIKGIFDAQTFSPYIDQSTNEFAKDLAAAGQTKMTVSEFITGLGVQVHESLSNSNILKQNLDLSTFSTGSLDAAETSAMSAVKRFCMVNQVFSSLSRVQSTADIQVDVGDGEMTTINQRFTVEKVDAGIAKLSDLIKALA